MEGEGRLKRGQEVRGVGGEGEEGEGVQGSFG